MRCVSLLALRVLAGAASAYVGLAALGDRQGLDGTGTAVAVLGLAVGVALVGGIGTRIAAGVGVLACAAWGLTEGWTGPLELGHDWPALLVGAAIVALGGGDWTLTRLFEAQARADLLEPVDLRRRVLLLQGGAVLLGAAAVASAPPGVSGGVRLVRAARRYVDGPDVAGAEPAGGVTVAAPASTETTAPAIAPPEPTSTTTAPPPPAPTTTTTTAQPAPPTTVAPATTTTTAPPAPTTSTPDPVLATSEGLRPGASIVIADRRHRRGLLVRRTDGTPAAFAGTCTHEGCPVDYVAATHRFRCSCSGCEFDADDGTVVTGPAVAALPRWQVDEADGAIRLG